MNRLEMSDKPLFLLLTFLITSIPGTAQITFSAPASYTVGTNPGSVISGDFNGDGISDLAVANNGDASVNDMGSVSLLLGNGDGSFQPPLNASAGAFPSVILTGDFNGDGKLDLFVEGTPQGSTSVVAWSVLFGQGDGTFAAPLPITSSDFAAFVVAGDFNNDKKLDLIFIDPASNSLEALLGNGDGTFQAQQTVGSFGSGPVVTADFNRDGKPDLAVATSSAINMLLGNGDGTFGPPISIILDGNAALELFAADVNGDGKPDLVATSLATVRFPPGCFLCTVISTYRLEIHLSNGDGSFQNGVDLATTSTTAGYLQPANGDGMGPVSFGDFDGDGKPDFVYEDNRYTNGVVSATSQTFIGGRGDGTFPTPLGTINGTFGFLPTSSDLNGDQLADPGGEHLTSTTIGVVLNTTQAFRLVVPASIGPLNAGGSFTGNVDVSGLNGFANSVSLTCGASHPTIHCSLSPSSLTPGSSSTLTVTTKANSVMLLSDTSLDAQWLYASCLPFGVIAFFQFVFSRRSETRRRSAAMIVGCVLLLGTVFQAACGGGSSTPVGTPGTPAGTYAITIIGTSGVIQRSTTIQLTVQ